MPKPRSIDPSFWDDPDISRLTRDERLLLVGMITSCADDEGRLLADAGYLRKRVFGYDDDVSRQNVQGWRDDICTKCRNVKLYEADGQEYIWFANWGKHQNMRYVVSSRLPAYPGAVPENTPPSEELLSNKEDYRNLPQSSVNSPSVALSSVALSSVSVGGAGGNADADAPPPTPILVKPKPKPPRKTLTAHPIPVDFGLTEAMRQWARNERVAEWIDLEKHTKRFIEYWTVGEGQGKCKKNWLLTWQTWMRSEAEKAEARGIKPIGVQGYGNSQGHSQTGSPTPANGRRPFTLGDAVAEHIAKTKTA